MFIELTSIDPDTIQNKYFINLASVAWVVPSSNEGRTVVVFSRDDDSCGYLEVAEPYATVVGMIMNLGAIE